MANLKFTLEDGLKVGDQIHKEVELRELTAGDMLDAEAEVEELVMTVNGTVTYKTSPVKLSHELLRRSIAKLGNLPMPLSQAEFRLLTRTDLIILQTNARKLTKPWWRKFPNGGDVIRQLPEIYRLLKEAAAAGLSQKKPGNCLCRP